MEKSVVIVDDHILLAKALSRIVNGFKNFNVLYEADNGKALIEQFKKPQNIPDIVLLDISMPIMNGFETAEWLRNNYPNVIVLTLTMESDDVSLMKMIKMGAKGYLLKNILPEELEKALNALITDGFYFPEWATSKLANTVHMKNDNKKIIEPIFSQKEETFLKYCCTEMGYKEIALEMNCSNRTVEGYRDAIAEKVGIRTRVGLALYAIKIGKGEL